VRQARVATAVGLVGAGAILALAVFLITRRGPRVFEKRLAEGGKQSS
jgi:hypothetical protein